MVKIMHTGDDEFLRLAAIVKFSEDAIVGMTLDGTIFDWNQGAEHIYGQSAGAIQGQHFLTLIPPDRRAEVGVFLNKIEHGEHVDAFETRRVRRDGATVYLSTSISPVRDSGGRITGASVITHDITKSKAAEDALAKERILLRTVVDNLVDHVYVKDAAGRYILDNPAHQAFLGVKGLDEVLEKTVFDFFPTEIAERYHADDMQIIRTGTPLLNREEPAITRAGTKIWLSTTKVPFRDHNGQIAGLVCVSRNITEEKQ